MDKEIIKAMFHTSELPAINFGLTDISLEAQKLAGKLSISGVQPKLSVKLDKKNNELIVVEKGGEYILKPQTSAFLNIPENEQCCMDIAEKLEIDTPPHCLLALKDDSLTYVVKRFDRENGTKIHQEDFGQILGHNEKYKGSVEQIGRRLMEISSAPGYDSQLFFDRVVLNFIVGNGDAHLKNYSISYKSKDDIRLAPVYDIVSQRLVIPNEDESALTINGKKNDLKRSDFDALADYLDIPLKIRYEVFQDKSELIKNIIHFSRIDTEKKERFSQIIKERLNRLDLL